MYRYALVTLFVMLVMAFFQPSKQLDAGTVPPIPERLLILGDSLTSGLYATHEQATFASILADKLAMHLARKGIGNLPGAVDAWSNLKPWKPALVVIEVGLNDVSRGTLTDSEWLAMYIGLLDDIINSGAKPVACTMFWGGIKETHPNYGRYVKYNQMIRDAAAKKGALLVDLWGITSGCEECISKQEVASYWQPHFHGDNFHPSDAGHALIATSIFDVVANKYYFPVAHGN